VTLGKVKRGLLIAAGSVSLGLGVLGIFVPLLPTTPFLLLTAACYVRSSERLNSWLLSHPSLGRFIQDYRDGRGMPLRAKVVALVLLWGTITLSAIFAVSVLWARLLLAVVAVGVTIHLLSIKTTTSKQ
jgi:uncharacterized membrane protein YbaN (DUF454 family)